ncbi:MAG: NAD(P)-binding protein [Acidobacteria bacterium]|nr:NAD(P)-binding protein [Acidobacteriota bacterium]
MDEVKKPKKIAVLGGGIGSLSAIFGITSVDNWQEDYEITVYQLGWRLGGKGASGRNLSANDRIEEHGLHVWAGFYDNSFGIMRKCYDELDRPAKTPLATWQDAFKPQSVFTLEEYVNQHWITWNLDLPTNSELPGNGKELLSLWDYIQMALELVIDTFKHWLINKFDCTQVLHLLDGIVNCVDSLLKDLCHGFLGESEPDTKSSKDPFKAHFHTGFRLLLDASDFAKSLDKDSKNHSIEHHKHLSSLLQKFLKWLWQEVKDEVDDHNITRRMWIMLDFSITHICGILEDGVLFKGFHSIDKYEWSEWMHKHGASTITINSPLTRGMYSAIFGFHRGITKGFVEGDWQYRAVAAGVIIHGMLRFVFTYKGALFWEMQASMGESVFTPLYQCLKNRGVKFEFFSQVKNLALSDDKNNISTITIGRQATLKPEYREYNPLINIKGIDCWPSEPFYDQLQEGELLKAKDINLESAWTRWQDVKEETLKQGEDFDLVILGISIGALKYICKELIEAKESWQEMIEKTETIFTLALQLWLKPSRQALGWHHHKTILTAYAEPFDTWGDVSQLIDKEDWSKEHIENYPRSIAYFCGARETTRELPPFTDYDFPNRELEKVKEIAIDWLEENTRHIWPHAAQSGSKALDWDLLVDPENREGIERFKWQYSRVNVNPSDQYVLSVPQSTSYRLKPDESGFDNLFIVGDWTFNALNYGCIEGTVITGLTASRAICGYPEKIIGEKI